MPSLIEIASIYHNQTKNGKDYVNIHTSTGKRMTYWGDLKAKEGDTLNVEFRQIEDYKGQAQYQITKIIANPQRTPRTAAKAQESLPAKEEMPKLPEPLDDPYLKWAVMEAKVFAREHNLKDDMLPALFSAKMEQQRQRFNLAMGMRKEAMDRLKMQVYGK